MVDLVIGVVKSCVFEVWVGCFVACDLWGLLLWLAFWFFVLMVVWVATLWGWAVFLGVVFLVWFAWLFCWFVGLFSCGGLQFSLCFIVGFCWVDFWVDSLNLCLWMGLFAQMFYYVTCWILIWCGFTEVFLFWILDLVVCLNLCVCTRGCRWILGFVAV